MDIIETILYSKTSSTNDVKLIDADWRDSYGLVLLLEKSRKFIVQIGDTHLSLTDLSINCDFPLIRWIDHDIFLIAEARNNSKKENLYILNTEGEIQTSFYCGDAIQEIVTSKEGIWVSYFDEGVLGSGISTEGLVLFSYNGIPIFRYHSDLLDRPSIVDCYAICRGKSPSIWLFPYQNFPLLCINPVKKTLVSYNVPNVLHGSKALCIKGRFGYFLDGYHSNNELYCWEIGKSSPQLIDRIEGSTRGLDTREPNHFISIDENNVKVYRIINHKEYE